MYNFGIVFCDRTVISDSDLLKYNERGLVPGPGETEEKFLQRVDYCFSLKQRLETATPSDTPFKGEKPAYMEAMKTVFNATRRLYDIAPDWVPVFYSNHKLSLWHGGCAWIFQEKENSPKGALLQLRKSFSKAKTYFLYDREELASHELAHVGRMAFEEPQFEELIACQSSSWRFRKYFGPLFQSSRESLLFLLSLLFVASVDVVWMAFGQEPMFFRFQWIKLLPVAILAFLYLRLRQRQKQWRKAKGNLERILADPLKAGHVLFRLTDREIMEIAALEASSVMGYLESKKDEDLRWRLLFLAYLSRNHE